jgi:hypothetical protein
VAGCGRYPWGTEAPGHGCGILAPGIIRGGGYGGGRLWPVPVGKRTPPGTGAGYFTGNNPGRKYGGAAGCGRYPWGKEARRVRVRGTCTGNNPRGKDGGRQAVAGTRGERKPRRVRGTCTGNDPRGKYGGWQPVAGTRGERKSRRVRVRDTSPGITRGGNTGGGRLWPVPAGKGSSGGYR